MHFRFEISNFHLRHAESLSISASNQHIKTAMKLVLNTRKPELKIRYVIREFGTTMYNFLLQQYKCKVQVLNLAKTSTTSPSALYHACVMCSHLLHVVKNGWM